MKTLLLTILAMVLCMRATSAQNTDQVPSIDPPFGLSWGESPENVQKWAKGNKHPMTQGKIKDGRSVVEVDGPFPEANFDRIRFYFNDASLTEVELQFIQTGKAEDDDVEVEVVNKAMAVKDRVDRQFGKGQLIKNEKGTDGATNWKFIQQIWTDEEHSIWLALFTANTPRKGTLGLVSLHYRWEKKLDTSKPKK